MANSPSYVSQSSVPGILKELYDDQKVQWLTYKDNPLYAMMKKETRFPGKYFPNPVVYGLSQGASATFASAYNNQTSPLVAEFLITRVSDFSLATIDGQLLASAQTDPGAFIDGSELMIDAAFQTAVNRDASAIFRNGGGVIGQLEAFSNTTTAWTITLANPDDATQFEDGQTLVAVQNADGSGTVSTDYVDILTVNRNTGVLTGTGSTGSPSSAWTNAVYYLAIQGDTQTTTNNNFQPSGSTSTNSLLRLAGLAAWLPVAGPQAGDSFFGVSRLADTQRLAGVSFNGQQLSLEEASLQGTSRIAVNGGRVDTGVCSYSTYTAYIISLGSKIQYVDEKIGEIGFRGVQINGANSVVSVFPDRNCPDGLIYFLESDTWILRSQGDAVHILKYMDEIEILRVPGVDAAELRCGGYKNCYTTKPGHNGVVQVQLVEF
jgi:hypothetical protein